MTPCSHAGSLALCAGIALFVAACGGSTGAPAEDSVEYRELDAGQSCGTDSSATCAAGGFATISLEDGRERVLSCVCNPVPRFDASLSATGCNGAPGWVVTSWIDAGADGARGGGDRTVARWNLCPASAALVASTISEPGCDGALEVMPVVDGAVLNATATACLPSPTFDAVPASTAECELGGVSLRADGGTAGVVCDGDRPQRMVLAASPVTRTFDDELVTEMADASSVAREGSARYVSLDGVSPEYALAVTLNDEVRNTGEDGGCTLQVLFDGRPCEDEVAPLSARVALDAGDVAAVSINGTCAAGAWETNDGSVPVAVELTASGGATCVLGDGPGSGVVLATLTSQERR